MDRQVQLKPKIRRVDMLRYAIPGITVGVSMLQNFQFGEDRTAHLYLLPCEYYCLTHIQLTVATYYSRFRKCRFTVFEGKEKVFIALKERFKFAPCEECCKSTLIKS